MSSDFIANTGLFSQVKRLYLNIRLGGRFFESEIFKNLPEEENEVFTRAFDAPAKRKFPRQWDGPKEEDVACISHILLFGHTLICVCLPLPLEGALPHLHAAVPEHIPESVPHLLHCCATLQHHL